MIKHLVFARNHPLSSKLPFSSDDATTDDDDHAIIIIIIIINTELFKDNESSMTSGLQKMRDRPIWVNTNIVLKLLVKYIFPVLFCE